MHMGSSVHDFESVAQEEFYRDLANHHLKGDGSSRDNPIGPREEGKELTDSQRELILQLAEDYQRTLLFVSGTTLYEIVPDQSKDGLTTSQRIQVYGLRRAAPNN